MFPSFSVLERKHVTVCIIRYLFLVIIVIIIITIILVTVFIISRFQPYLGEVQTFDVHGGVLVVFLSFRFIAHSPEKLSVSESVSQ